MNRLQELSGLSASERRALARELRNRAEQIEGTIMMDRAGRAGPRRVERPRRGRKPFFGFPLMNYYAAGCVAMAKCLGLSHRQLFDQCLFAWQERAETALGFDVVRASDLTAAQIAVISRQVKLAHKATGRGGNAKRN